MVPVGEDQSQHLELTRELAKTFNSKTHTKTFLLPKASFTSSSRVASLRDPTSKMSKSATNPKSRITIIDSPDTIRKKLSGALTDSVEGITYQPEQRPGISNLIDIAAAIEEPSSDRHVYAQRYEKMSHKEFKNVVSDILVGALEPIRARYYELESSAGKQLLEQIGQEGAMKARSIARQTMQQVRASIGL